MNIKIVVSCLIFSFPLAASLTPFLHDWYDGRTTQMKFDFDYNQYDPALHTTLVNDAPGGGTGSVAYTNDMVVINIAANYSDIGDITGSATVSNTLASYQGIDWAAGHETHVMFTASFAQPTALVENGGPGLTNIMTVWSGLGVFDASNGVGLGVGNITNTANGEFTTGNMVVFVRTNGVTTYYGTNFPQSLNGTPPSNFQDLNLYRIVVSDKATGPITFEFYNGATNTWTIIHQITNNQSTLSLPQLRALQLPLAAACTYAYSISEVFVPTASASLQTTGWHVMTVGDAFVGATRSFSTFSSAVTPSATESHVMTIQNSGISGAKTNHVPVKIKNFGPWSNRLCRFKIYKNATVTGTSFSNVNVNTSVVRSTTTGTYTGGTGTPVFATTYDPLSGDATPFDYSRNSIMMYPGDTLTITSQLPFDTTGQGFATIAWDELF